MAVDMDEVVDIPWDDLPVFTGEEDIDGDQDYVYALLEKADKRAKKCKIKIGYSGVTDKRVSNLRAGNPRELGILKQFPVRNGRAAERAAHQVAEGKYERIHGEWFSVPKNQLEDFLADIQRAVQGY